MTALTSNLGENITRRFRNSKQQAVPARANLHKSPSIGHVSLEDSWYQLPRPFTLDRTLAMEPRSAGRRLAEEEECRGFEIESQNHGLVNDHQFKEGILKASETYISVSSGCKAKHTLRSSCTDVYLALKTLFKTDRHRSPFPNGVFRFKPDKNSHSAAAFRYSVLGSTPPHSLTGETEPLELFKRLWSTLK